MENQFLQAGDVNLASFPFGDRAEMKLRAVLLLTGPIGNGNELLVAYISSAIPPRLLVTDILLDISNEEYAVTGLKATSLLRQHKLATIHTTSVQRRLGAIGKTTRSAVRERLNLLLSALDGESS